MASLLYRLGKFSFRNRWWFLIAWLVILLAVGGSFLAFSKPTTNNFTIPGTESQSALNDLQEKVPSAAGGTGTVVFESTSDGGFTDAERQAVNDTLAELEAQDFMASVTNPFATEEQVEQSRAQLEQASAQLEAGTAELEAGQAQYDAQAAQAQAQSELALTQADQLAAAGQTAQAEAVREQVRQGQAQLEAAKARLDTARAELETGREDYDQGRRTLDLASDISFVSEDNTTAYAPIQFTETSYSVTPEQREQVQAVGAQAEDAGLNVYFSKEITEDVSALFGPSEIIGVAVAAVVLLIMLGTLVAAGLPLLLALVGVISGVGATMALTGVVEMTSVSPILALMLGLAVGIDYSLFIINRHRGQILAGMDLEESAGRATGTSGNAVLFAGLTVVIALAALAVPGLPFLTVMGLAAAGTVALAIAVALTLTPAFLGFAGRRLVSRRAWAKAEADGGAAPAQAAGDDDAGLPARAETPRRWGRLVTRHPVITLILSVLLLGTMALPASDLRLGLPDGGSEPVDSTAYQAYDLLGEKFGEGVNGAVIVVGYMPDGLDEAERTDVQLTVAERLSEVDNVRTVVPGDISEDGSLSVFQLVPEDGPAAESTEDVVHEIRDLHGEIKDATGVDVAITGMTGVNIDLSDRLAEAMPIYLAIVVGLSLVLLLLVFRSILVPLLATGGFLLSLMASFGAVVAIYQWGWLGPVFDVQNPSAVLSFLPIILTGVLFGLAMDYQMFLVSGMREAYAHGEDARKAVRTGFDHGARVVTAAAIIMVSVFAGFIYSHLTMVRPIGFALAFGVLLDAFVIRMTFIPAVMHLLGKKAWWLPKWLDRILPDVDVEGARLVTAAKTEPREAPREEAAAASR